MFNISELYTIKRALIIYNKNLHNGLRGKGFFIDVFTCKQDIENLITIKEKLKDIDV